MSISKRIFSFLVGVSFGFSCLATAQTLPSVTSSPVTAHNAQLTVTITGYPSSPTKKVSGTNENFQVSAKLDTIVGSTSISANGLSGGITTNAIAQTWVGYISRVTAKIGGEIVLDKTGEFGLSKSFSIRWATTHFPTAVATADSNKLIELTAEATFVQRPSGVLDPTKLVSNPAQVSVNIYNRGLAMSTQVAKVGTGYMNMGDPPQHGSLPFYFLQIARYAISSFSTHSWLTTAFTVNQLAKQDILDALSEDTFSVFATHGTSGGLSDYTSTGQVTWSDISARPRNGLPARNAMILYACSCLATDSDYLRGALVSTADDHAVVGFTHDFNAWEGTTVAEHDKKNVFLHARKLTDELSKGTRLFEAVENANRIYKPLRSDSTVREPMTYIGDGSFRIINVYLSQSEWQTATKAERDSWYRVR